ncbi:MAG: carboxypeptidase regulatory-like domain-containing protein, partial [Lepagella sp.]
MSIFTKKSLFAFLFAFALAAPSIKTQAAESLPYTCDFSEEELATWSLQDLDGDGFNWYYGESNIGGYGAASSYSSDNDVNNVMLSPAIALEANSKYILSFTAYTSYYERENLEVGIGTSTDVSTHTIIYTKEIKNYYGEKIELTLPQLEGGEYYLSFRHYLDRGKGMIIVIKDLKLGAPEGGTLKGKVTLSGSTDCSGVSVCLAEDSEHFSMVTGADGEYQFVKVPAGNYTVVADRHGYLAKELTASVADDQTTTLDIALSEMPKGSFTGNVSHSDGSPVVGAKIEIIGYDQYRTVTDADGKFSVSDVTINDPVASVYTIVAQKNLLNDNTIVSTISESEPTTALSVPMTQSSVAPLSISADRNGTVTWKRPAHLRQHLYDNDEEGSPYGYETGSLSNVIGNLFPNPMTLHRLTFYSTEVSNQAETLTIYVIGVDSNGQPTGNVLYTTKIPNMPDTWSEVTLPTPLRCDNGCAIAIAANGAFGIARDTNTEVLPGNKSFFATFYTAPDTYRYFSELNYGGALMIRAFGENIEDTPEDDIEYLVQRHNTNDYDNPDAWVSFPATQGYSLTDSNWDTLPQGYYIYTVKARYTIDDVTSEETVSERIEKDMRCNLTLHLTTNSGNPDDAEGALFEVYHPGYDPHTANVENGSATISNLLKGDYSVRVSKKGFESYNSTITLQDGAQTIDAELNQKILPVVNIDYLADSKTLAWDLFADIHEDFDGDDFADFEIDAPGEIGWNYYDGDMYYTYGFSAISFPGMTSKMAAIIFNGSETSPEMPQETAHSGQRALACFDAAATMSSEGGEITKHQTDDWFITPALNYHRDFKFSFYGRSYTYTDGMLENVQVGYSTTGMAPEDFTFISGVIDLPVEYEYYEFEIPKEAKYVAINNCTFDGFFLLIDDVAFTTGIKHSGEGPSYGSFTGYRVTVDGNSTELPADVTTMSLSDLAEGSHTASIVTLYASGESAPLTLDFNNTSGIVETAVDATTPVIYYNLQGIEVTNPGTGIYIRKQGAHAKQIHIK